jgi:hypothetical protein
VEVLPLLALSGDPAFDEFGIEEAIEKIEREPHALNGFGAIVHGRRCHASNVHRMSSSGPSPGNRSGDVAVLNYQLVSYGASGSGKPYVVRWNSTKVYARPGSEWKMIHDHWSYIKPDLKEPDPE